MILNTDTAIVNLYKYMVSSIFQKSTALLRGNIYNKSRILFWPYRNSRIPVTIILSDNILDKRLK